MLVKGDDGGMKLMSSDSSDVYPPLQPTSVPSSPPVVIAPSSPRANITSPSKKRSLDAGDDTGDGRFALSVVRLFVFAVVCTSIGALNLDVAI